MSEGAENDETEKLRTPETVSDFDEAETSKVDTQSNYTEKLTENELQIIQQVKKFDIECDEVSSSFVNFKRLKGQFNDEQRSVRTGLPRVSFPDLDRQIKSKVYNHPTIRGLVIPAAGYSEIVLRSYDRILGNLAMERIFRLVGETSDCRHQEADKQLPTVPITLHAMRGPEMINPRLHVTNIGGRECIEISNASPLAMLLFGRRFAAGRSADSSAFIPTLKVDFGGSANNEDVIVKATDELVQSFLYELDVRNGLVLGTYTRRLPLGIIPTRRRAPKMDKIRYPKIGIRYEVAGLFSFASQANDNPSLAFLSYYQTLEYFIPAAVRQNALKMIRRELKDPEFEEDNDNSLMRIITVTERSVNIPEASQLRTLVNEFVRVDRLVEFFQDDWGGHFGKKGPIAGVDAINIHDTANLVIQVAERVYRIRNRIVHAKDDPKYQDSRVLLPQSQEAQALRPDVELARFLAMEAILAYQGSK